MSETKYIAKPKLKAILSQEKYKYKYQNQKEFALAVGVKEPTISRFDNQSRYDINTLISISKELELSVEDLFDIEKNPNYVRVEFPKYDKIDMESVTHFMQYLIETNKIVNRDLVNDDIDFGENISEMEKDVILETLEHYYKEFVESREMPNKVLNKHK